MGNDEESAPALGVGGGRGGAGRGGPRSAWGKRGISVSADDTLGHEGQPFSEDEEEGVMDIDAPDAKMKDPDELALALEEDEEEGAGGSSSGSHIPSDVRGGDEWRD